MCCRGANRLRSDRWFVIRCQAGRDDENEAGKKKTDVVKQTWLKRKHIMIFALENEANPSKCEPSSCVRNGADGKRMRSRGDPQQLFLHTSHRLHGNPMIEL